MNAPVRYSAPDSAISLLRTLVVSDLADSTALVERLGDQRAAEIFRGHDRLVRDLIHHHGGQEIDKTDGFLSMFERPIQAVAFALAYQRALTQFNQAEGIALAARTGIHVGDVVVWQNAPEDIAKGAKPLEVEGLVKPVASRLMGLALPQQILLSGVAYSIAHRAEGELTDHATPIRWRTHGRYRFKGVPEAVPVFEVGEDGIAPLKPPAWTGKAHRETPIWRRPLILGVEAILALALIAIPAWYLLRPEPAIAFANRDWVVVGDLKNLTGDTRFDDALQAAFRIGLEQSRYVNVLSDLQVRDALSRMERDPAATGIDRVIGSEVAQREGARALILPTIAEIGGRVRFTAEVVDPQTQATVYSDSADGLGVDSVLPSVDEVNRDLRTRLGEALAAVPQSNQPLEKVATADFDALRAYSLGVQANDHRDTEAAVEFFKQATAVDPGFTRARIEHALILRDSGDRAGALEQMREAAKFKERLSERDRLYIDAWLSTLTGTPRESIPKWRLLADLYPDSFAAQGAHGFHAWVDGNRYDDAIKSTQRNAVSQNPRRGTGHYLLGTLYLGKERYREAIAQFELADAVGAGFQNHFFAASYAAQRQFDKAQAVLDRGRAPETGHREVADYSFRALLQADQGRWTPARQELAAGIEAMASSGPRQRHMLASIDLGARLIESPPSQRLPAIERFLRAQRETTLDTEDPGSRVDHQRRLILGAWLAAREVEGAPTARKALERLDDSSRSGDFPELAQRVSLVDAELVRNDGRPADAVVKLRGMVDGNEFYVVHVALMDALAAAGDYASAREEATWLTTHRGRGYSEIHGDYMLQFFNIVQSNLAWLAMAEFSLKLDDGKSAAEALAQFDARWPDGGRPLPIDERVASVRDQLGESGEAPSVPLTTAVR